MTAPDLSAIRAQLAAITPGPWEVRRHDLSLYVEAESGELNPINLGYVGNRPENNAAFIAAAPSTVTRLLGIVERVEAECAATDTETDEALQADLVTRIRAAITGEGGA